ncbi:hypothetical protein Q6A73_05895 [Aliarcobacter skirrowii]|uniref:hypothetical protein n=1 Tax=Aliarcobacter skirrowii TaxID=28200 RepID=UPI0029A886BA|nr:hypothetical protein [Aliarcobacter skirrowii]MDX4026134.1 hypothetical protein [Aliarcobacter skirrowii]MDX4064156.1 hypothetical protein [Aliarcobacter skirrowii]MDX4071654.1 hypothetical protein [Aliarcobacter skirrowii]
MELGIRPNIDQYKENATIELQQVKSTFNSAKTDEQKELQQIQKKSIENAKGDAKAESIKNDSATQSRYEVVMSNTNFGFNTSSEDFYVKVSRGNVENQYPTEDMMRVKAQMLALQKAQMESNS